MESYRNFTNITGKVMIADREASITLLNVDPEFSIYLNDYLSQLEELKSLNKISIVLDVKNSVFKLNHIVVNYSYSSNDTYIIAAAMIETISTNESSVIFSDQLTIPISDDEAE